MYISYTKILIAIGKTIFLKHMIAIVKVTKKHEQKNASPYWCFFEERSTKIVCMNFFICFR